MKKAELKTKLIPVEYWDCGKRDHRHRTEIVAQSCIEKQHTPIIEKKWTYKACAEVLKEYRRGIKTLDIAKSLGLTRCRVNQIIRKAERDEQIFQSGEDLFFGLSAKIRNCILNHEIDSIDELHAAMEDGRIDKIPNLGYKSKYELQVWLENKTKCQDQVS